MLFAYVLLRLNACCYALKYEEQICSQLLIFQCIMTSLKKLFKIEFERRELEKSPVLNPLLTLRCVIMPGARVDRIC